LGARAQWSDGTIPRGTRRPLDLVNQGEVFVVLGVPDLFDDDGAAAAVDVPHGAEEQDGQAAEDRFLRRKSLEQTFDGRIVEDGGPLA
jgi:hypothetical protein